MKTTFVENDGCFAITFVAENMEEAALCVRAGVNSTSEVRYKAAYACKGGHFEFSLVLGKHKNANSDLPKRR